MSGAGRDLSVLRSLDLQVLLCDADGNLFPSEEPAFDASTVVVNRFLADLGIDRRFTPPELRAAAVGRNFRATALALIEEHGSTIDGAELERYVVEEREAVVAHLRRELRPDPAVHEPLSDLSSRLRLAIVSSSALSRLDACIRVTGLAELFPPDVRFSAEDSLPVATSKPDPAVYAHAGQVLEVAGSQALAVEDAPAGVESADRAGFPVVGNLALVPVGERAARATELVEAGAMAIVESWAALRRALDGAGAGREPTTGATAPRAPDLEPAAPPRPTTDRR